MKPHPDRPGDGSELVVGLGASAGGLEALEQFLSHVSSENRLVFVVAQHLEPRHPSILVELLSRHTEMPVLEIADGLQPQQSHVYVVPPGMIATFEGKLFRLVPAEPPAATGLIDRFFRSLAEEYRQSAVGILFSGAGHDGTVGLRAIKERGGLTLAQSPETAKYGSMPQSAIEAGLADYVLPPADMPGKLLEHAGYLGCHPADGTCLSERDAASLDARLEESLERICSLVHLHTGHDFSRYKTGTLVRRIGRRMQLHQIASVDEYVRLLEGAAGEPDALLKDLLIGVTHFFRDPEAFLALAQQVVPVAVQSKAADAPVRMWVPGCASGEEAYSIAILFREHFDRLQTRRSAQIFATDLDNEMLAQARRGRYPKEISEQVSPERLARFFTREGEAYVVSNELREICIFSEHSLLRDPPFSQLDLISCRNVLIYLNPDLQKRLVPLFHYALRPGGFLFLGPSEGVGNSLELFETTDKRHRIFRRKETVTRPQMDFPLSGRSPARPATSLQAPRDPAPPSAQDKIAAVFERTLLDEYTFPSAVINERGDALFIAGRIHRYLQPGAGPAGTPNLLEAFHGSLRNELRIALRAARTRARRIVRDRIPVEIDETPHTLRLIVRPMPAVDPETGLFLVVLQEHATEAIEDETADVDSGQPAMEQLENELRTTRAELKATVEELESANEEMKSSNEELISTNEELQSANEELQTSREELQSLNEELETVNTELRQKVDELAGANSDLQNLFAATEIATIFLDRSLRVAKFTPAATALFHFIDSDIGRPLADLAPRFAGNLVSDAQEVLRLLTPVERQVQSADGAWFVLRILPYRTIDNAVAGILITFIDVSEMKRAEETARQHAQLVHLSHDAIFVRRFDGLIQSWNRGAEELYGYTRAEAIGRISHDLLGTIFPTYPAEVEAELRRGGCWVGELQHRTKDGRLVTVLSNLQYALGEDGIERILEANRDITGRKAVENRLLYLASFPEHNPNPIVEADLRGHVRYANPAALERFPDLMEEGAAHPWLAEWHTATRRLRETPREEIFARNVTAGGRIYQQSLYYMEEQGVIRTYGMDVTELRSAEATLRAGEERFRSLASNAQEAITRFDREGRYVYVNPFVTELLGIPAEAMLGKTVADLGRNAGSEIWETRLREVLDSRKPVRFDRRSPEGTWFDVQLIPEFRDGEVETVLAIARDVTARKHAEDALRESEARYSVIHDKAPFAIALLRLPEGTLVSVNDVFCRLFEFAREEVIGRTNVALGIADPKEQAQVAAELERRGCVRDFEAVCRTKFGKRRIVAVNMDKVEIGGQLLVLSTAQDITDRKTAEAERDRLARQRQLALDSARMGWWHYDPVTEAATCDERYAEIFGISGYQRNTQEILRLLHPEDLPRVQAAVEAALNPADPKPYSIEFRIQRPDGSMRWVEAHGLAEFEGKGKSRHATSFVGTVNDITERKQAEEGLRAANEQLQEADRRKNEFLAVLSHELRNPLTPIRSSLYILEHAAPGSEQAKRAREIMARQSDQLARLVDDLLDVTRVTRNKIKLQCRPLELNDLVRRTVDDYRSTFDEKHIRIETDLATGQLTVNGDEARLAQVVGNLLQNTVKFTAAGGQVRICTGSSTSRGRATLRVSDTGAGIEPEILRRLFQPFMQADTTLDRSKGGLGLGLALVKALVEMHGGEVCAHSDGPGKGSEFVIELPLHRTPDAQSRTPAAAVPRRRRRVLLIEDNIDAAASLKEVLNFGGHLVEIASSGPQGLVKAREFKPEIVLCDIGLPGMDGFEVAKALRADPSLEGTVLVALSGYALAEDLQRASQAGFHHHLAKPPSIESLEQLLAFIPDPK